jgi:twitching motility protein PilT
VNVLQQKNGVAVVMRVLSEQPPTLEKLNLPEMCRKATSFANGLVLVTGPTGSGKSTTLAAMINDINMKLHGHILTLEDPIEFQHESKLCAVSQRSFGADFTSFGSAMRAAFREDPDVILVGEMRDPETISLAIKAAETGRLVFSTLHTNSASKTVDRMINVFPADEQAQIRTVLSETLRVIISQKLVPSADKKKRYCIHDILVNTKAVANLIREGKTFQIPSLMQTGKEDGMQIGDKIMLEHVEAGRIKGEIAWEYANEKNIFAKWAPKDHVEAPNLSDATPAAGPPIKKAA